jgi:DNA-binding MarR family transcriptional regulator
MTLNGNGDADASQIAQSDLARSPSHLLHRAQQISSEYLARAVRDAGLTHRQYVVLSAVAANEGLTQTALVEQTGIDRSTLAELINRMEKRGLVVRERAPHDARANVVSLGEEGRQSLKTCQDKAEQADQAVLSALPKAKRASFLNLLAILTGEAPAKSEAKPKADSGPAKKAKKSAPADDDKSKKKKKKKKAKK